MIEATTPMALSVDARLAEEYRQWVQPLCDRWVHDVQVAAGSLHLPREQRHDHPGWLSALPICELAAVGVTFAPETLAFEVPLDCAWWHEPERMSGGCVFRFFARSAWLELPARDGQTDLTFLAGLAIQPDALWQLSVSADDIPMVPVDAEPGKDGWTQFIFRRDRSCGGSIRVKFSSPVAAHVNDVHRDSTDHRYLSLAIGQPTWVSAPADDPV